MPHMLPDPEQTERFRQRVAPRGGQAWALGWMHRWTVEVSRIHAATCQDDGCATCKNFVTALSLFAAVALEMPQTPELRAVLTELYQEQD